MKLPPEVREQFARYGQQGGEIRAARLSPERRKAIGRRAATQRWVRSRFGASSFGELGLPGGALVDQGLLDLIENRVTLASLLISIAAPRLVREGVPVSGDLHSAPEEALFALLSESEGDFAHARYLAYLQQIVSFANALERVDRKSLA